MRRIDEKCNNYINLWVRSPGCTAHSVLTIVVVMNSNEGTFSEYDKMIALLTSLLVYWNGIYFMNQVVVNYSEVRNKLKDD